MKIGFVVPGLVLASTFLLLVAKQEDVDGRDKPGHDDFCRWEHLPQIGHSGMVRKDQARNLEIPGLSLRTAPE